MTCFVWSLIIVSAQLLQRPLCCVLDSRLLITYIVSYPISNN
uniref:Uncharacterized protein n=1 Tax=Rhizophora mucronata TaxID=61149 RepID=A0A2P2PYV2_RHIMU